VITSLATLRDVEAVHASGPVIALRFADGGWVHLRIDAKTNPTPLVEHVRKAIEQAQQHPNDPFVEAHGAEIILSSKLFLI
jgi:hypothetical protein